MKREFLCSVPNNLSCWATKAYRIAAMYTQVDLWVAGLYASKKCLRDCYRILSTEEQRRAERFRFATDRTSFVIGRALLREILAMYLQERACTIRLAYGPQGKPTLAGPGGPLLQFNVAHSANMALYAFSPDRTLGIDVERVQAPHDLLSVAREFFAPDEYKELSELPESERSEAFFRCWTRKEAYSKGRGWGLSIPLAEFRVPLGIEHYLMPIRQSTDPIEARQWSLLDVSPAKGYVGALAVKSSEYRLRQYMFSNADECRACLSTFIPTGSARICGYESADRTPG
jgi:4'-phosphopantetheinyl transferase